MLTTERKKLVVHVTAKVARGGTVSASGYVVSPGRVLTAAHALNGIASKSDIKIRLCDLEADKQIPAKVIWNGKSKGGGYDTEILAFDPNKLSLSSQRVCREQTQGLLTAKPPSSGGSWECYGLPAASDRIDQITRKAKPTPLHWQGPVNCANPGNDIDLTAWTMPNNASDWCGASGTAVFIDGRLCALIIKAHERMKGMLSAQWLGPLFKIPDFVKRAGLEEEQNPVQALVDQAARLLSESPKGHLVESIATNLECPSRDPRCLAQTLSRLTIEKFLTLANRLHEKILNDRCRAAKDQRTLAKSLEDVVDTLLPTALVSSGSIWRDGSAGSAESMIILTLPCATMTIAEVCLANLDSRKSEYASESLSKAQPYGIRCIHPWARVHIGFGEESEAGVAVIFQHLVKELAIPEPLIPEGPLTKSKAKPVDDVLRRRSDPATQTGALGNYYFLFQDPRQQKLAENLQFLLPHLRVCQLSRDQPMPDEPSVCDLLKEYLQRKSRRENHKK